MAGIVGGPQSTTRTLALACVTPLNLNQLKDVVGHDRAMKAL